MTSIDEINGLDDLAGWRPAWHRLLAETEGASFFQTLEWLEVYWRHFGPGQRLRVLIASAAGRPTGIMPLVVREERTKVGQIRVMTYPLHGWGSFYGPIGPQPGQTLAAGLAHVRRTARDWDVIELRWVDALGADHGQTEQAMRTAGLQTYRTVWEQIAVIDMIGSWEDYLASRTSKWRNNLRRAERRLSQRGHVEYVRFRPQGIEYAVADPRWDLYDACENLAGKSWQGSSSTGTTLSHESIRQFLRDAHAAAAAVGAVDVNLLLLDGSPLAFAYNYHGRGNVIGLRAGYDADLSRDGAGTVLGARMVEDSFRRGDRFFDLGPGYLASKRHFLTRLAPSFRLSHFHPATPRALLLRVKRWLQQRHLDLDLAIPVGEGSY
jgi:CelD/BcsL family acetyltransferase involved in cellulose biosynthesis